MGDRAGHSPGPCVVLPYDVEIAEPHAGEVEVRDRGREQPQRWCKSPAALQESKRHLKSREAGPCAILPYDVMISEPHAGVLEVRDRDARRGRGKGPQGLALEGFLLSRSNLARITAKEGQSCRTTSRRARNSTVPMRMR